MDALHPRLLASRFDVCFRFYDAVLPPLVGAVLVRGSEAGPYASWDVGGQGAVMLLDRGEMASVAASVAVPSAAGTAGAADMTMLVSRVPDVAAGYALCLARGATSVAPPTHRPQWGSTMRTAHVRDPEGNLWELQSY